MLELAEAALDEVTFFVDRPVEVELLAREGLFGITAVAPAVGDGGAEVVGILGCIGQDDA